ncbi:twin-arginine translocase TatA/TatE family subunit [Deinococcus sonorensis]|uniref:Sec-independent protein translocase protein TatA n=2 Tax=Deinococcus sonorensis TaxID=309891 RepID=A0AAU7U8I4_9DEIO
MPNLGFPEIMIILVVALLIFGPKKLPELGKSLGNGIREFRKGTQGLKDELEGSVRETPVAPARTADQPQTLLIKPAEPVQGAAEEPSRLG